MGFTACQVITVPSITSRPSINLKWKVLQILIGGVLLGLSTVTVQEGGTANFKRGFS